MRDLDGIGTLIVGAIDDFFHPVRLRLLVLDPEREIYQEIGAGEAFAAPTLRADSGLGRCLGEGRVPLTRERLEESPDLAAHRAGALGDLDELEASLVLPILFRGGVTGIFALGDKRSGAAYSTFDLRVLRLVANQSAVAIENARAYTALQQANTELLHALRRVEILESIRANLSKFVPATVQRLIEEAPESPELDKREVDVSVLFVDIAGYTRRRGLIRPRKRARELYFGPSSTDPAYGAT